MTADIKHAMRLQRAEAEKVIAHGVRDVAAELRLIDLDTIVEHVIDARHDTLDDIIDSATELYFRPGALRFNRQCSVLPVWNAAPVITFGMVMRHGETLLLFDLGLTETHGFVRLHYLYCGSGTDVCAGMGRRLQRMFDAVRLAQPEGLLRESHRHAVPATNGLSW